MGVDAVAVPSRKQQKQAEAEKNAENRGVSGSRSAGETYAKAPLAC